MRYPPIAAHSPNTRYSDARRGSTPGGGGDDRKQRGLLVTSVRTDDDVRTSIQASQHPRWHLTARQMGLSSPQFAMFEDLGERIRPMFARPEPHRQAMLYMLGLLGQVERKNSWQLAGFAGEESPWRMQRLLNRASWDVDGVRDVVRDRLGSALSDPADP